MQCYNHKCAEYCDELKIQYCISKITEEQFQLLKKIGCRSCGTREVKARYKKRRVYLCTNCGAMRER